MLPVGTRVRVKTNYPSDMDATEGDEKMHGLTGVVVVAPGDALFNYVSFDDRVGICLFRDDELEVITSSHIDHVAAMIRAGEIVANKTGRDQSVNTADNIIEYLKEVWNG